jgi:hypothetical protein
MTDWRNNLTPSGTIQVDPTEDALKLINTVILPAIDDGCRAVNMNATIDDEAKELFKRRYRLSIENRLSNGVPPSVLELDALKAVGNAHGKIAAAIWEFRQKHANPPPTVDPEVLTLAAHIMEFECRDLMIELITAKKPTVEREELGRRVAKGIFCW